MSADATLNTIAAWEPVIANLAMLGVKSWGVIHALLQDAGADDAVIAALAPKWDALYNAVQLESGLPPANS